MGTLTPLGEQAEQIKSWVWEDPEGRAQEAHDRLNELAHQAGDDSQALHEIQDVGTMVARLLAA